MKLTFIGLGKMGSAMVERLLQAGYEVAVYNRTPAKTISLVEKGAIAKDSVIEAVKDADVVMSCLLDDKAVTDVSNELLPYLKPGAVHISLATILPDTAVSLSQLHQKHNCFYLSAVVLGVPKVVKKGELTTFCAGEDQAIETAMPLLETFSSRVIPLGNDVKAPNVMKICMNYSLMTAIELISELYAFAEKSGLDSEIVKMGLHQIYGHPGFKGYIDKIHARNFDEVNFDMLGGNKDVTLFQQAFNKVGVAPELANVVKSRFNKALKEGMENKDWSGIYEIVRMESELV